MADKAYKVIIEGENGAGSQVFEAETPEELQAQFKEAQTHATAKIREQAKELAAERAARQQLEQSIEPVASPATPAWKGQLTAEGLGEFFGLPPEVIKQRFSEISEATLKLKMNEIGNSLYAKMPEIYGTNETELKHNGEVINKIHKESGFPESTEGYEAAALLAKQRNILKLAPVESQEVLPHVPTTVTRPSVQVNTEKSRNEFLTTAPTEEVRKLLEKEWAMKQRA